MVDTPPPPQPLGWRVVVHVEPNDLELVADELFMLGALGLEEQPAENGRVALLAGMPDAASAGEAASRLHGAVEAIVDDDWADAWRAWARPVRVGEVLVTPVWVAEDASADSEVRYVIVVDPGRAFGSGGHESTRLALDVLLEQVPSGARVLDIGCGSGVLSVAAALAKQASVVAIDVDEHAVAVTRDNAERNGVAERIQASSMPIADLAGSADGFDVVVANILAVTLREIAADIARVVAPNGVVVLSGMITDQVESVDAAYAAVDFAPQGERRDGAWVARWYRRV